MAQQGAFMTIEERRERQRLAARERRRANPELTKEIQRRYRENHPNRSREWWQANTDRQRAYKQARRARIAQGGGAFTEKEWRALCEHYGGLCVCCGLVKPLTADHIVPVSKGGSSDITNIQPLCGSCNSAKSDQTTDYRPDKGAGVWRQPRPVRKSTKPVRWHRAYEVSPRGEGNKSAKLTSDQVRTIRQQYYEQRKTFTELSREYGVDRSTIARAVKGETWTHI